MSTLPDSTDADRADPPGFRYFDDFVEGECVDLGQVLVTEPEVVEFARQFDPQPMHIDPEVAERGQFGGLIASGWHTVALSMRLYVDRVLNHASSIVSPGVDEVRWLLPVRPGDTLHARWIAVECKPSVRRPDRGVVHSRLEVENQGGELVMTIKAANIFKRRRTSD